jgi:hypothetical protein
MNPAWHAENPMPPRATLDQRVAWHVEHAKWCACRPVPATVRAAIDRQARAARTPPHRVEFAGPLFKWSEGPGSWYFVAVPTEQAPPVTHSWGRTPVRATVDGQTWETSVWRGKDGRALLAVPKRVRGAKGDGDTVRVRIAFDAP